MLIVNPNNRIASPLAAVEPPLWASLIASYWDADILDAEAENLDLDQTEYAIRQSKQEVVLIVVMGNNPSVSSTPKMPVATELAKRIKDLKVSMTGIHPLAAGCEYPVWKSPYRGFPMTRWDRLPMRLYRAHNWHCLDGSSRSPYASIYTSLGCPFDCYYCNIHVLYPSRKVQLRPVESIVTELKLLASKYGVRNIKIWDELFAIHENRVLDICKRIEELKFNIWAYARLDSVTPAMLTAMQRAGINWLAYGFESVKDPKFRKSEVEDVIKATRDAGIAIMANFMFGLPNTTEDDDRASLEFAMNHLFEYVNFYDARPYPGSQWWKDLGSPPAGADFDQLNHISSFRHKAFNDYMSNSAYQDMLRQRWGQQAVEQIKGVLNFHKGLLDQRDSV